MKKFVEKQITEQILESVTCDCCGKEFVDIMDMQEFAYIDFHAGYASAFPDESRVQLDLCSHCMKELLGKYVRITY